MTRDLWRSHGLYPLLGFAVLMTLVVCSGADLVVADALYRIQGGEWMLRNHWLTAQWLHHDANRAMAVAGALLFGAALASLVSTRLRPLRAPLWYLLASMSVSTLLIGLGKQLTQVDCPWDLLRYGGERPYLPWFAMHAGPASSGRCFPAGHAGGGYAWVASYFFLREIRPARAPWGLTAGVGLGMLLGLDQQLRGAHFLSHDLWALAICWSSALLLYALWRPVPNRGHEPAQQPNTAPRRPRWHNNHRRPEPL